LLRNAAEALEGVPDRRRRLRVRTRQEASGFVEVVVEDSGPGLPKEQRERIFEPFHTTKPNGMGVGLAICRTVVQSHGGRIWAESSRGGGAAFHFTLPAETETS
jgi:two-component system sensor kinase FixL